MKRLKSTALVLAMLLSLIPFASVNVSATDIYDRKSALTYASNHWNDETTNGPDKDWCAGFVSHCLIKGNIVFTTKTDIIGNRAGEYPRATWDPNFNAYYYVGCWGLYHDLAARNYTEVYTLKQDDLRRIPWSQNTGHIAKGDIIFYHIKNAQCNDTDQYTHVVIVGNDSNSKYVQAYAHNNPKNNGVLVCDTGYEYVCIHFKNAIN